jgi:hypothetical protein
VVETIHYRHCDVVRRANVRDQSGEASWSSCDHQIRLVKASGCNSIDSLYSSKTLKKARIHFLFQKFHSYHKDSIVDDDRYFFFDYSKQYIITWSIVVHTYTNVLHKLIGYKGKEQKSEKKKRKTTHFDFA